MPSLNEPSSVASLLPALQPVKEKRVDVVAATVVWVRSDFYWRWRVSVESMEIFAPFC